MDRLQNGQTRHSPVEPWAWASEGTNNISCREVNQMATKTCKTITVRCTRTTKRHLSSVIVGIKPQSAKFENNNKMCFFQSGCLFLCKRAEGPIVSICSCRCIQWNEKLGLISIHQVPATAWWTLWNWLLKIEKKHTRAFWFICVLAPLYRLMSRWFKDDEQSQLWPHKHRHIAGWQRPQWNQYAVNCVSRVLPQIQILNYQMQNKPAFINEYFPINN